MKKLYGLIVCMLLTIPVAMAQQDPLYAQYILNPFVINPAYAGYAKDFSAQAGYRLQWAGFEGSPVTMNATGNIALLDNKMGLGLTLLQDKIGTHKTTEMLAAYAYHVALKNNMRLSFGLQGGIINYRNDFTELTIDTNDPKFQNSIQEMAPTVGSGIIFSSDKVYLSFSVPKLLRAQTPSDDNNLTIYNRHMYFQGAYLINLTSRLKLKPFVLARYVVGAPLSGDVGVLLQGDDSYSLGIFSRALHTYGFLAKINLGDQLRFGYVLELPTSRSVGFAYTVHELTVGIRMRALRFHDINTVNDF